MPAFNVGLSVESPDHFDTPEQAARYFQEAVASGDCGTVTVSTGTETWEVHLTPISSSKGAWTA